MPRPDDYVERRTDGYREPDLVLLVGTAHLSTRSAEDVRRVVAAVRPENVVVELCRSRSGLLQEGAGAAGANSLSLSGGNLLEAYQRTISLGGRSALILRLFLGALSSRLSSQLGVQSGVEFRAAREAAEAVNAQLVLGDRPIEVTLRRAWEALPPTSRWKLAVELTSGVRSAQGAGALVAAEAMEALKGDDAVSFMLASLAQRFPEALAPLVHERDLYLAWSLKRSKAVNGTKAVVGVVGKGHVRGVCYALTHDAGELRFRDLAGSRPKAERGVAAAAKRLAVETGVVAGLWWCWTALHP